MPKQILLVEDNTNDAEMLLLFLRKRGIVNPIQAVPDGEAAIDYLYGFEPYSNRQQYPFPAVLILDLKMPRKSGFDVLEWLQSHPEIPASKIIIFTEVMALNELEKCYRLGATSFLLKQTMEEQFRDLLRRYPEVWEFADPAAPSSAPARPTGP